MPFNNLRGEVISVKNGTEYIISDKFAVMHHGNDVPEVYDWSELASVTISDMSISVNTGSRIYSIPSRAFESRERFLRSATIAEVSASDAGVFCNVNHFVLPPKSAYCDSDLSSAAAFSRGEYNVKDMKASLMTLLIGKVGKLMWTAGILGGIVSLVIMHFCIGFNAINWWYLLIGGFFCGVGAVAMIYIFSMLIVGLRYSGVIKAYSRFHDEITFAISQSGYSICESCVYSNNSLIRWNPKDTYIETATMFIITRGTKPVAWIQKNLFEKDQQDKISDILALNLSEK